MALTDNLLHYYKFDGSNSNDSVGSNNGTDTAITYSGANGKINNGAGFNGSTSQISYGTMGNAAGDSFTVSAWVKLGSTASTQAIVGNTDTGSGWGWLLRYDSSVSKFSFLVTTISPSPASFTANGTTGPSTGTFYYVSGVWSSGSSVKIYVNGTAETTTSTTSSQIRSATNGALVGVFSGGSSLNGAVDELAFWNRATTDAEQTQLYNAGAGFQWPFSTAAAFDPMLVAAF